ncbi:MAG: dinitrogenase iron-molybdenum cofactor biosynthesis protein [Candidatus Melainabacteria bacterium GWF2_32_7]|nr:MAG: dinitrogenase iron-molybdenum cofactor biosynthesis protein [Candidatus Melainabacteria bacterium GWF2_32_7]
MKIAITANGKDLNSNVDLRFGRAFGFIIYDMDNSAFVFIDNEQNLESAQGAGIQAAQNIVNQNVEALITGHCGPKAFKILSVAGINVYTGAEGSVKEAIEKFKNNELQESLSPDVEGHW